MRLALWVPRAKSSEEEVARMSRESAGEKEDGY